MSASNDHCRLMTIQGWGLRAPALTFAVAVLCAGRFAGAQESDAVRETAAQSEGLAEVVVTSTKRAQNVQDTAVSVSVLSSDDLERRAIREPAELNGLVPGVSIQPSFILLTYIRGLGNYSSQPGVDQSAAYNVDGIYISKPYGMPTVLFDLERVEMLRGPQGTLEGRNAVAGSINFITAKPTEEFAAKASVSAGNYSALTKEAMVNLPLSEGYALRLSGATAERDGYFDNGFGDQNVKGGRIRLLARPVPQLEAVITGEYTERDELGMTYSPCPPGSTAAQGCEGISWNPWAGTPGQGSDDVLNMNEPNYLISENKALYAEVNYDFDFGTLTWVPSYRDWDYANHQSLSGAFGYAPSVKDEMHSQELRLASTASSAVKWVTGLYYARETAEEQNYFTTNTGPYVAIDRRGFRPIGHVYFKNDVNDYSYESQSAFGEVSVPLADDFRIVAGLRYTQDKKVTAGNTGIVIADPVTGAPTLISTDVGGRLEYSKLSYKAGVEYDVAPEIMLYANVSTGYKAGAVNGVPPGSDFPEAVEPEEITAYQAGIKSQFFDRRAQVNAETFFYDYEGYQTSLFDVTDEGILIGGTTNSQKARLYGGEIESIFLVTDDAQLAVSTTYLSTKHTKFEVPEAGAFFTGYSLQNAPRFTLSANYDHTFRLSTGASIVAHLETRHERGQWVDYRHSAGAYSDAHWRHGADVTYQSAENRWSVGAFIRNITNSDPLLVANAGLGPYMLAQPYPPRTYGLRLMVNF